MHSYLFGEDCNSPAVYLATVPKTGSYLLQKVIQELGLEAPKCAKTGQPHIIYYLKPYLSKKRRLWKKDPYAQAFKNKNKYIVTFRDPRDFFISYVDWIDVGKDRVVVNEWSQLSKSQKLHYAINCNAPAEFEPFTEFQTTVDNYIHALELRKRAYPNVLFLRFEDLIGPELGGNSKEAQKLAITKLCKFYGQEVDTALIDQVCENINQNPGYTYTSNQKVHKWKKHFDKSHLEEFRDRYTYMLIELGYEDNANWADLVDLEH